MKHFRIRLYFSLEHLSQKKINNLMKNMKTLKYDKTSIIAF